MSDKNNIRIDIDGEAGGFVEAALEATRELTGLKDAAIKTAGAFAAMISADALLGAHDALVEAQKSSQKLSTALVYVTGTSEGAAASVDYLRQVTRELGVDFASASNAYAKFAAASKGMGISSQAVKDVFEGVAAASAKMGLSADETSGALLALSQMASKGVVSAEELRGQLGERLPGALKMAAQAMGVTQAEMSKMLEKGEILASDFLPKFGAVLRNEFGGAVSGLVAETNRLNSAWEDWKRSLGNSDGSGMAWLTRAINESSAAMRELGQEAGIVSKLLISIGGFQFGAIGKGKFDTQQLQKDAMAQLSDIASQRRALESASYRTPFDNERLLGLLRQEKGLREDLLRLAERRGRETGLQMPDLAGEVQAAADRSKDALSKYLAENASAKEKALKQEEDRWNGLIAIIGSAGPAYETALSSHLAKLAEIRKKYAEKKDSAHEAWLAQARQDASEEAEIVRERIKVLKEQKNASDLLASYGRQDKLAEDRIARSAELAAMSERERVAAAAVYQAEDQSARRQEQIIKQITDETARTKALATEKNQLAAHIDKVREASLKAYDDQRSFEFGWNKAFQGYEDAAGNAAQHAQDVFKTATDGMADAMTEFAVTGKLSFSSLANDVIRQIMRMQMQAAAAGIVKTIGGFFGLGSSQSFAEASIGRDINSAGLGGYHSGGIVGSEPSFIRYHTGGIAGDEVPAILKRGEGVFTEGQMKAMGGTAPVINMTVINQGTGDGYQAQSSVRENNGKLDIEVLFVKAMQNDLKRNGPMTQGIGQVFGLNRSAA